MPQSASRGMLVGVVGGGHKAHSTCIAGRRASRPPFNLLWGPHHRNTVGLFDSHAWGVEEGRWEAGRWVHGRERRTEEGGRAILRWREGPLHRVAPRVCGTREVQATLRVPVCLWSVETLQFTSIAFLLWLMAAPLCVTPLLALSCALSTARRRLMEANARRPPIRTRGDPALVDAIVHLVPVSSAGTGVLLQTRNPPPYI